MSTEIIEYSSSITDEETENIIKVMNKFIIFLKENDIDSLIESLVNKFKS